MSDQETSGHVTARRHIRRRNRVIIMAVVALCVVLLVAAAFIGYAVSRKKKGQSSDQAALGYHLHGHWADWEPWSDCSATCGGGIQARRRTCSDPAPQNGGSACIGPISERRKCAAWLCPNCSRTCPDGGTLTRCTWCRCPGTHVSGEVTDADTVKPIYGVAVYAEHQEWIALQITNQIGTYEVKDMCVTSLRLVFRKKGYEEKRETVTAFGVKSGLLDISLKRLETPQFHVHPADQAAFTGTSVAFTCNATAYPAPSGYDWFKDGEVIAASYNGSNTLVLKKVTRAMAGSYKCRANSIAGKMFSNAAKLFVTDKGSDSCDETPVPRVVRLPVGCTSTVDGEMGRAVDIGSCSLDTCRSQSLPTSDTACCAPVAYESVSVTCQHFSYSLSRIKKCGCAECHVSDKASVVKGEVYAIGSGLASREVPARAKIIYGGSSVITNAQSGFTLSVPVRSTGNVIKIVPLDHDKYVSQMKVLKRVVDSEVTQIIEINKRGKPHIYNTSTSLSVSLGSMEQNDSLVSLVFPKGLLVDKSGQVHEGKANVYTSFSDPRQIGDLRRSPGEFLFVNENGDIRSLYIYGVMCIQADDGNDRVLTSSGKIRVKLNTHTLGIFPDDQGEPDVALWGFNSRLGNWDLISSPSYIYVKKRDTTVAGRVAEMNLEIPTPLPYILIAKPLPQKSMCTVRVALYSDNTFTEHVSGGQVLVYTKTRDNNRHVAFFSDVTGIDGAVCVAIPCGFKHEISVQYIHSDVLPAENQNFQEEFNYKNGMSNGRHTVKFQSPQAANVGASGPLYRATTGACQKATRDQNHFKFALTSKNGRSFLNAEDEFAWYKDSVKSTQSKACMVRIEIETADQELQVVAVSRSATTDGAVYGTYTTGLSHVPGAKGHTKVACVLVKCPDDNSGSTQNTTKGPVQTFVDIGILPGKKSTCQFRHSVYQAGRDVGSLHLLASGDNSLRLRVQDSDAPSAGYSALSGMRRREAEYELRERCLAAAATGEEDQGYAASYECQQTS